MTSEPSSTDGVPNPYAVTSTLADASSDQSAEETYLWQVPTGAITAAGISMVIGSLVSLLLSGFELAAAWKMTSRSEDWEGASSVVYCVVCVLVHLFVFQGSRAMVARTEYLAAWYASLVVCVPCFGFITLIPGVISVVLLSNSSAKSLFSDTGADE